MRPSGLKRFAAIMAAAVIIILHAFVPFIVKDTYAKQSSYFYVSSKDESFWSNGLHFMDINFHDFSDTTILAFGVSGEVRNDDSEDVEYLSEVSYYGKNNEIIAISRTQQKANRFSTTAFAQMSNLDIISDGYSVSDIYYYVINIDLVLQDEEDQKTLIPSQNPEYNNEDYVIDAYDVDIEVGENNIYKVKEKITAYFSGNYKHGIVRSIPLYAYIERLDGTSSSIRTEVRDLRVNEKYSLSRTGSFLDVRIGKEDVFVHGKRTYEIEYNYNFGKDVNEKYDEFYFDIIGHEWDTAIGGVTFSIHMPKAFDSSKIGFSSGRRGSTDNSFISYNITGNTITGKYEGILEQNEGVTIRAILDDGYYVGYESMVKNSEYIIFGIPIVCLLISIILWLIFGNDKHSVESIEFYPPKGLNTLDIALILNRRVKKEDVITLLFVLANKGYIRIEEKESKKGTTYTFHKLKNYNEDNENERKFFEGLFKGAISKSTKDPNVILSVTANSLKNKFYKVINSIIENTNRKSSVEMYFENTKWARITVIILAAISFVIPFISLYMTTADVEGIVSVIGLPIFYIPFWVAILKMDTNKKIIPFLFVTAHFFLLSFGILSSSTTIYADNIEPFYIIAPLITVACVALMVFISVVMPRRTQLGSDLYGKIKGLKTFIKTADKYHLEQIVIKDKQYAYRLLPYAYVLGLSKKWMKKFKDIGVEMEKPDWYDGNDNSFSSITHDINTMIRSTSRSLSTSPQSHSSGGSSFSSGGSSFSSGGSSGGGFSGGGGGGGGGHSW